MGAQRSTRWKTGHLTTLHRGIYLVGPTRARFTPQMAAVLAHAPGAFLSHRAAGKVWALLPYLPNPTSHDVTVTAGSPRQRSGIRLHRATLIPDETTTKHGIPITTPTRTLLDLAAVLDDAHLEQAIAQAYATRLTTRPRLDALLEKRRGHRGSARLKAQLSGPIARSRSKTERRLLTGLRRAGVPEPETNAPIGGWEVDMLWRDRGLAVEIDGYDSHSSPRAFRRDYRKTAELEALGLRVIRVSADQVWDELEATVRRIAAAI